MNTKKFLSLLLIVALLVGILSPKLMASATTVGVTSYSSLAAAIAAAPSDGTITTIELQNSFSATDGALTIAAGQNIVLTSTVGAIFTFTQATSGQRHFNASGSLTLQNVTLSGPGGGTTAIFGGVDVSGGTLTINSGGTITNCRAPGSNSSSYGGGVNVHNGGTLILNGGAISNNATNWVGGGVLLAGNSTFTMYSGTISGNTSVTNGGGISIQNGTGTISGGTIASNVATSSSSLGGGINLQAASLTVTGGSIINNRANNGGGIYVDNSGSINMSAGTISNNVAASNGGGIYTAQYTSNNPLPPNSYINLAIGSAVVFSGNVAGNGARIPPSNVAPPSTQIQTTSTSSVFGNPLNNLDINYFGQAGVMVMYLTVTFSPGTNGTFPAGTQTQQSIPTTNSPLVPTAPIPTPQPTANYGFIGWSPDGGITVLTPAQVLATPIDNNTTYVAQYAPPITLTFDGQSGAPATQTVTPVQVTGTYASALAQVTIPVRPNYVFRGWWTTPNGTSGGVQILPTSIVTTRTNQTLYAWWIPNPTITITFDANSGTPPTQIVPSRVVGNSYAATLAAVTTPTRVGYAFQGWNTQANGLGTQITTTSIIPAVDTTLYAQWILLPPITITYNAQGGTPDGQPQTVTTGNIYGNALPAISPPTRPGYVFSGWWTTPNGDASGVQILPTTIVTATTNQILYAHWVSVTVTVTFNAGTGAPSPQVVSGLAPLTSYAPVFAAIATPTLPGYTFQGWYTQPQSMGGSSVTTYSVIPPMDTTVYAWWTPNPSITVTFDAGNGTPTGDMAIVTTGYTYAAALAAVTEPTLSGYFFQGWFTEPTGGIQVLDTTIVTATADHTLYAYWTAIPTVTITFAANDGTSAEQVVPGVVPGNTYADPLASIITPTQIGFIFNGWFTATTSGTEITASDTIPTIDTTLYAQWTPRPPITVTFNAGSGTPPTQTATVTTGGTYATAMSELIQPTLPGFLFQGWFTASSGGVQVLYTTVVTATTDQTLYAHWTPNPTITITFNANSGAPALQVVPGRVSGNTFEATLAALTTPTQDGFVFRGWFTAATGGTQITASSIIPAGSIDRTVYAQWDPIPTITITFDAQGGTPDGQQKTLETGALYGDALSLIQPPARIGYVFVGWFTTPAMSIQPFAYTVDLQILADTIVTETIDQTLYAHWIALTVTITFDAQGGTPAMQIVPGKMPGDAYAIALASITEPTKAFYTFLGWFDAQADGTEITDTATIPTTNTILYAQWAQVPVVITFDALGATPAMQEESAIAGNTFAASLAAAATPIMAGNTFVGWFTQIIGGMQVNPTDIITQDQTVYARFTPTIPPPPTSSTQPPSTPSTQPPPTPSDPPTPPINQNPTFREDITLTEIHDAFLIGAERDHIAPTATITRAEAATILLRIISDETRATYWTQENPFPDVPNNGGAWFSNAVSVANHTGIMTGFPDGTFRPNRPMTRAEVVAVMTRFLSYESQLNNTEDMFPDIATSWARTHIHLAATLGWVQGDHYGNFNPNANVTRAEFATMVNRMLNRTAADIDIANMKTWVDNADTNAWFYWAIQIASNSAAEAPVRDWAALQLPNASAEDSMI
ncbi:MAG: InlB B-repeat-containing protein [Oscillospiraceae bacterium]|nr:InlB B-repeat-containing protein [Oscillospiraceae bacterium]